MANPVVAQRAELGTLFDAEASADERESASAALGLDPASYYRVVAVPGSAELEGATLLTPTAAGFVRFGVRSVHDGPAFARAGIGSAVLPLELRRSQTSALLALRMTGRRSPVLRADDLGAMLLLIEAADALAYDHADLTALKFLLRAQPRSLRLLEPLADTANVRDIARESGLHVDEIRARADQLRSSLGFDPLSKQGRVRLSFALSLFRLQTNRFE